MASVYESLSVLGRGSYGTALLVRERQGGGSLRVLKEVDLSRMPPAARQEASKEVDVLKSLSHSNIIAYCDTFIDAERLCIVMEYADDGSLADVIARRRSEDLRFPEEEALSVFSQSCSALQHIHAKRILHRDLKSQNIFLMKGGIVKLGDFGISKILDYTQAEAFTVIGTPSYLAPEVCDSQPYGTKADIWSLGVVLYEILTLELPFQARSLAALIVKIVSGKPRLLAVSMASDETRQLVKRLLQKKPEKRISTDEVLALPVISRMTTLMSIKDSTSDADVSTRASTRNNSVASLRSTSTRESSKHSQKEDTRADEPAQKEALLLSEERLCSGLRRQRKRSVSRPCSTSTRESSKHSQKEDAPVEDPAKREVPPISKDQICSGLQRRSKRSVSRACLREGKGQRSESKESISRSQARPACGIPTLNRKDCGISIAVHNCSAKLPQSARANLSPGHDHREANDCGGNVVLSPALSSFLEDRTAVQHGNRDLVQSTSASFAAEERTLAPWVRDNNVDVIHPGSCNLGQVTDSGVCGATRPAVALAAGRVRNLLTPLPRVAVEQMASEPCDESCGGLQAPRAFRARNAGRKVVLPRLPAHARQRSCCLIEPMQEADSQSASPSLDPLRFDVEYVEQVRRQSSRPPWRHNKDERKKEATPRPNYLTPLKRALGEPTNCASSRPASTPAARPAFKRKTQRPASLGHLDKVSSRPSSRLAKVDLKIA